MDAVPVRIRKGDMSFTFHLDPLLANWEEAKAEFVVFVSRTFGPGVRPQDFTASASADMAGMYCRYRIYDGFGSVVLRADSVEFDFPNAFAIDNDIPWEIIRQAEKTLLPALDRKELGSRFLSVSYHAELETSPAAYLARFADETMARAAERCETVRYRPSASFLLRSDDGSRTLRRTVEQSRIVPDGLFVTTRVFVPAGGASSFLDEIDWIRRVGKVADAAVGIAHIEEENDAESAS